MIRRLCLLLALASPAWADHFHAVKHHVAPVVQASASVSYDTSIGLSVDANGRASLPLHTGASRYYVNSSTGSDSNSCATAKNPATPKATVSSGLSCAVNGNGDQILIAQGTSYTAGLPIFTTGGFSAQYPTVIESYDPTDPTNEAKLGIAGTAGRPVLDTGGTAVQPLMQGSSGASYFAIRGLDFNPGLVVSGELKIVAPASGTFDHILFENNIFRYTQLTIDNGNSAGSVKAPKIVIRDDAFYGSYGDAADHEQGIYASNIDGLTIEDDFFWHNGWKPVGSSSFTASISGETMTVSAGSNIVTGQLVGGTGVAAGTFVTALGTGTGGSGTYTLGTYQSISTQETMTGGTVGSSSFWATISGRTLTVNSMNSGTIVTGQVITGSGVLAGTTITNQQSGTTGQAGKYTIDVPETISSEAMTGSESRSMPADLGGDVFFNHAIYAQTNDINTVVRRIATLDSALEMVNLKGGGIVQGSLSIRNAAALNEGGGDIHTILAPFGVYIDAGYNAAIGSNIVSPGSGCSGCGLQSTIGRQNYSLVHSNVIARNDQAAGTAFMPSLIADVNNDGILGTHYVVYDHNVSYLWNASGSSEGSGFGGTGITASATNNIWDDPTSGTNTNVGSVSFPNAYTETSLLAALPGAYASEAAAAADWLAHPEQHGWENAVPLMLAGYGVTKAQMDLGADLRFTAGVAQSGQFIGTLDGYTISETGGPSCMTIDDSSKAWRTDTTCTVGSGTASITETNGTNTHVTSLPWTVYAQPVLSSLSVTPGTTTATINVSASVGSGTVYAMVDKVLTTLSSWGYVRAGVHDNNEFSAPNGEQFAQWHGSEAITATGAQTPFSVTNLTTATAYRAYLVQVDANNNVSAITTFDFTTN